MTGRPSSVRAQAEHYRLLAHWTSDARTHDILLEMARELEESESGQDEARAGAARPRALS